MSRGLLISTVIQIIMQSNNNRSQSLASAFRNAFHGMVSFFRNERNGKIQLVIAVFVLLISVLLKIGKTEWLFILICTAVVISLEMINSAIEKLCDMVEINRHPVIRMIKDVSAAAVLWSVIFSVIIGIVIFLPYILK